MRHDLLADVLSAIKVCDNAGKKHANGPASTMVRDVLKVLQKEGFVSEFEFVDDKRGGTFRIALKGVVNGAGAIRPRFSVSVRDYGKYERRFLPASGFGVLVVSTSQGVMTQVEAKEKKVGGKLLAYVY